MDSNTLKKFEKITINLNKENPLETKQKGVYVLVNPKYFSRLNGKTNILYIGKSENKKRGLKGRLGDYLKYKKNLNTAKRIHKFIKEHKGIKFFYKTMKDKIRDEEMKRKTYLINLKKTVENYLL